MRLSRRIELKLWLGPDEADNRSRAVLLILLIPLMLFSAWQFVRREENENRLALVASEIALRDVDVSCPASGRGSSRSRRTPAGSTSTSTAGPATRRASRRRRCRGLERVWRRDQTSFTCLSAAAATRTRCAPSTASSRWRTSRGTCAAILNEAQTQCYAIQTTERVALRLGVAAGSPPDRAPRRRRRRGMLAGEYHSPECRPGGAYDLHPETPDWPTG